VLKYLGTGAVVSAGTVVGVSQLSQPASASVALTFDDAEVELPEDRTIEDLRLVGEVTGDYNTGGLANEGVRLNLDVQFDSFGSYEDTKHFTPSQKEGTVSWEPSHSLVEETDFDPEEHVEHIGYETDSVSYNATVEASITLLGGEAADILVDTQTGDTATITFHEPDDNTETPDDGDSGNGTEEETASASVEITFGFEVDK
jgi:hypothetical protein